MKVVLHPTPAFGHMIPFYQLALALAKAGVHVYYISTPRNIDRLPKVPLNIASTLEFVPIQFPETTLLPEGAEATTDIPPEMLGDLGTACDLLEQPVKQFVVENRPDWLIVDFTPDWAADIAKECGVPLLSFSCLSAAANVFIGPPQYSGYNMTRFRTSPESLTSPPFWVPFPSTVAYRRFESIASYQIFLNPSGRSKTAKLYEESKAIAIRTCREIEGEYLSLFAELLGKPVIPVGFLPPELPKKRESVDESFCWLDQQKPKSVVFVGFGSECRFTKEQISEIAIGLEESGFPFLWSLRTPVGTIEDLDSLPEGFLDRTDRIGKMLSGWAPQFEILAHPAIRVFLFHSGWGSIIEAMQFGHALVALPMVYDQGLNARLVVEKGLAIEVERNEDDGSFKGKDIAKCLKQAMATTNESECGCRVKELVSAAKDISLHDRYMDEFVNYLFENKVEHLQ